MPKLRTVYYTTTEEFTPTAIDLIRAVTDFCYLPDEEVEFILEPEPGPHTLNFGGTDDMEGVRALSVTEMMLYPNAGNYLASSLAVWKGDLPRRNPFEPLGVRDTDVLYLDLETHNAGRQYDMPPEEFFRLGQFAWGHNGDVVLTDDYEEVLEAVRSAGGVVAQNGHLFDFSVLFGPDSVEALLMAKDNLLFDTKVWAALNFPAPSTFRRRDGRWMKDADKPGKAATGWFSLDNLSYQLGLPGKEGDLRSIAVRYNPKGTPVDELDYGLIDINDPEFRAYAEQDVHALRDLTCAMLLVDTPDAYSWREQLSVGIDGQNSRNGFAIDIDLAQSRSHEASRRRAELLDRLVEEYGFPTEGKSPWSTKVGREATLNILRDNGVFPEEIPGWKMGKTGPSLAGDILIEHTKDTPAEFLGRALAELKGARSLSDQALMYVCKDGKVHPEITALQRSGRKSTTKPGLTTWTSRGPGAVEKEYLIADEGCMLVSFDYSNADARIVAAYSGDEEFAKRFEPGADGHEISGRLVFGDEVYESNPIWYRQIAKACGHAWNYGGGPKTIARTSGQPFEIARQFVNQMNAAYPDLVAWQNEVRKEGKSGSVTNHWGRVMVVERGREYTQAPALYGQSGTREIMVDALIRMLNRDIRLIQWLKAQVHDELVFSIPVEHLDWAVPLIEEMMETTFLGQHFPVSKGDPAPNWYLATHD